MTQFAAQGGRRHIPLGPLRGSTFPAAVDVCDREAVTDKAVSPSLTYHNPARSCWWALLALVTAIAVANVIDERLWYDVMGGLFAVAAMGVLASRASRLTLTAAGDELVIRNFWSTHTVSTASIRRLDFGRPSVGKGQTLRVVTADASIPIDVFAHSLHVTRGTRDRFERRSQELADWLQDGR